jgi:phosphoribosylformimino-5-aminoimidazole carboxamide ribotide isomerase
VRLSQGNYSEKKVYNQDPLEVAKMFEGAGLKRLHLVDLDGAKARKIINGHILNKITTHTSLTVDFGGGVQSNEDIQRAFELGASMVTGGSIAVKEREIFTGWIEKYGSGKIILGADCRARKISVSGWEESTSLDIFTFIGDYCEKGIEKVVCTDISKDGMMQGPSVDLYKEIMSRFPTLHLIASGGVGCFQDILDLEQIGVPAVILGKAIYENKITLEELVSLNK